MKRTSFYLLGISALLLSACGGSARANALQTSCLSGGGTILSNEGEIIGVDLPPGGSCNFSLDIAGSEETSNGVNITVFDSGTFPTTSSYYTLPIGASASTAQSPTVLVRDQSTGVQGGVVDIEACTKGFVPQKGSYYQLPYEGVMPYLKFAGSPKIKEIAFNNGNTILYFEVNGSFIGVNATQGFWLAYENNGITGTLGFPTVPPSNTPLESYQSAIDQAWKNLQTAVDYTKVIQPEIPTPTPTPASSSLKSSEFVIVKEKGEKVTFQKGDQTFYDQVKAWLLKSDDVPHKVGEVAEILKAANRAEQGDKHLTEIVNTAKSIVAQWKATSMGQETAKTQLGIF